MKKRLEGYLLFYLIILLSFAYFFLFLKHGVGNDSTISEWLINYEGGFTKRGIIGQIAIEISRYFNSELRWVIFILQTFTITSYFLLLFYLLKKLHYERVIILSIFTPIFILYPVAEIEVLARKEIIVFCSFLIYFLVPRDNKFKSTSFIIFLTFAMLVWEPIIIFFPLILLFEIIENNIEKLNFNFIKIIFCFIPSLVIALIIFFNPLTVDEHTIMKAVLKNEFGENCYMSCHRLITVPIEGNFKEVYNKYSFEVFFRYSLIILIGFFPLLVLLNSSSLKNKNLFIFKKFNKPIFTFYIALLPVILLFAAGYDWGRWVNISYVMLALIYYKLLLNNHLILNFEKLKKHFLYKIKGKAFIFLFIIYCFGWNPKTVISGDVASFPGYRIPYKVFKIITN